MSQSKAESDALVKWVISTFFVAYFINFSLVVSLVVGILPMARCYIVFIPPVLYLATMFATWVLLAVTGKLPDRD
jgi:hypothetical protein